MLFQNYPVIQKAYEECLYFRRIMEGEGGEKNIVRIKKDLLLWMKIVENDNIDEMLIFKKIVGRNIHYILNHFRYNTTNSVAYSLHNKIQCLINSSRVNEEKERLYYLVEKELS